MKNRNLFLSSLMLACASTFIGCEKDAVNGGKNINALESTSSLKSTTAAAAPYKVAYYAFDNGGLPLTTFAKDANVVILFEGTIWSLADPTHYPNSYAIGTNDNYKTKAALMKDIRTLQDRGVKVLYNLDDANSWTTSSPFTNYDDKAYTISEFASFVKTCVIDSLKLDGIALDVEHVTLPTNDNYKNLITELGKHFGPLATTTSNKIYSSAIYSGADEGNVIGKDSTVASYMNFVMDMGYFSDNETRFYQYSKYIGAKRTMIGVSKQYNTLEDAITAAKFKPYNSVTKKYENKAGIMVYAANQDSSYTGPILRAATN